MFIFGGKQNGLGDRIKAITGIAVLAMAMGRPLRMSLKENVWDFNFALENPYADLLPWHRPWQRFFDKKAAEGQHEFRKRPSDHEIKKHMSSNKTLFYGALGGDRVADGQWLENIMAETGRGPSTPGSWAKNYERCIARSLSIESLYLLLRGARKNSHFVWQANPSSFAIPP
jgi:hypothetical protein